MIDQFGRTINYLRISVTDRCNLRCQYCMPEEGVEKKKHRDILSFEEIDALVSKMAEMGVNKIRITGGEPLVRKNLTLLISMINRHESIREITMTTNGIYLAEHADALKSAGLKRVNISLDSLKPDRYQAITRGGDLSMVLKGIEAAKRVGLSPIKINVVLMKGVNDDEIDDFIALTKDEPIEVRFIELMPVGEDGHGSTQHYLSNTTVLDKYPNMKCLPKKDPSSPATYYQLPEYVGKVGLISPISGKFCEMCNRVRLSADGFLKYCLHSNEEIALKPLLKDEALLEHTLRRTVFMKPEEHQIDEGQFLNKHMVQIGG